jgi:hypothetical protein
LKPRALHYAEGVANFIIPQRANETIALGKWSRYGFPQLIARKPVFPSSLWYPEAYGSAIAVGCGLAKIQGCLQRLRVGRFEGKTLSGKLPRSNP